MSGKFNLSVTVVLTLLLVGCAGSATVVSGETPMLICHDVRRTLNLPEPEAVKHLDHGDSIGACKG